MRTHIRPVLCPYPSCDETKAEPRDMLRHISTAHRVWGRERGYKVEGGTCDECGMEFTRKDNLKKHKKGGCKKTG